MVAADKRGYSTEKKCGNCWRTEALIRMCNKHPNNPKTFDYTCTACEEFHRIYEGPSNFVEADEDPRMRGRVKPQKSHGKPRSNPKRL